MSGAAQGQKQEGSVAAAAPRSPERLGSSSQLVMAAAIVLAAAYLAKFILITLLVSILLAFMLAPIVELLERFRMPRGVAALIAVITLLAAGYGVTYFSYSRAVSLADDLPRYTRKIRTTLASFQKRALSLQKTTAQMLPESPQEGAALQVRQQTDWGEVLTRGASSLTDFIFAISFIPFLVYFMLTWQSHVRAATVMLFPMEHRHTAYVTLGKISAMVRSFIVGNVLIGLFLAVLSVLAFFLLGLPYFYLLGAVSGFLSLVPYLGVVLGMVPPLVASLGGDGGGGQIVGIILVVLGLHLFALNVLYPKLLGRRLQLNPLVVTVALLMWGWLWGAMGLILAVPIVGAFKIICDHVDRLRPYGAWLGE